MLTQEERLTMLEQTVTALSRGIQDINHNETLLLGMAMKQQEHTREIRSSLASLSEHLDTFEQSTNSRFGVLSEHLDTFEQSVNGRFETLEQSVNNRFGVLGEHLDTFEQSTNSRFEMLEQSVNGRFGVLETTLGEHTSVLKEHTSLLTQILARLPEKP